MNKGRQPEKGSQEPMISVGRPGEPAPPGTDLGFKVDFEEARESEDYHSLYQDLDFVVSVTRHLRGALLQQGSQPGSDASPVDTADYVLRSLWVAALVTYGRCFHTGKRTWLNESVFDGKPEAVLEWHRYFRNTRDKHITHSVNPFETNATGVHVVDHDGENPRVESVVTLYVTRVQEEPEVVKYLEWLATYARDAAWEKHKEASNKVLEKAESLSKEQLRRLRPLEEIPQTGFEAAKKRRR
jgi:hypothetical protein